MKHQFGTWLMVAIWAGGLVALQVPRLRSLSAGSTVPEPQALQAAEVIQRERLQLWQHLPVLGFENLVASWTFLNFIHYFGNREARRVTGYTVTPDFFDVIVRRDPFFRLPYQFLSSSVTLFAGQPTATVRLLERGLAAMTPTFPTDSFWLWRYKAVDELLFLGDTDAAIQSLEKAVEWAQQSPAPDAERSAYIARQTAQFLQQDPDSRQVRANAWALVWNNAIDEEVRQYAQAQIESLGFLVTRNGDSLQIEDPTVSP